MKAAENYSDSCKTPEEMLWKSVLETMIRDAICTYPRTCMKFESDKAKSWFNIHSKDFRTVCEYAGYDPRYIYEKMSKILKKGEK